MVYFVQPVGGGPVKIGVANDVNKRLKELENQHGHRFVVLATKEGNRKEEHAIHVRFSHLRCKGVERFRPEPDLMEFIKEILSSNGNGPEMPPVKFVTVRFDRKLATLAKHIAVNTGVPLAEVISEAARSQIETQASKVAKDIGKKD